MLSCLCFYCGYHNRTYLEFLLLNRLFLLYFPFQVSRQARMLVSMPRLPDLSLLATRASPWSSNLQSSMSKRLTVVVAT